ncbi:MAG: hypothetical protein WB822_08885, partial [Rhodoplanes sp.]
INIQNPPHADLTSLGYARAEPANIDLVIPFETTLNRVHVTRGWALREMTMPSEFQKTTQQELAQDAAEAKARSSAIGDDVRETAENLRGEFASAAESTKEQIGSAGKSMKEGVRAMANDQKAARAQRLGGLAHTINLAAEEMQDELPQVAGYVRDAAERGYLLRPFAGRRFRTGASSQEQRARRVATSVSSGLSPAPAGERIDEGEQAAGGAPTET